MRIGRRDLFVYDGLFSQRQIRRIYTEMSEREYDSDHASVHSSRRYREWMSEIDLEQFKREPLFVTLAELVQASFPAHDHTFFSVFCNCTTFGGYTFTHQDAPKPDNFSVLYYVNPTWKNDWAGETTLFDARGDAIGCLAPKPGRIVVFDGRIRHRAGLPSRICRHRRYTLSLRAFGRKRENAA